MARSDLLRHIQLLPNGVKSEERPKSVILMLGDGMGYSTITLARYEKALRQSKLAGDLNLNVDSFPFSGSIRTFSADNIVTDSAASATAYLTGCKANNGCVGVDPNVTRDPDSYDPRYNAPDSIHSLAKSAGFLTGLVTNQPITHASPAPLYAHTHSREFEYSKDSDPLINKHGVNCMDIASQFVNKSHLFDLVIGGGRGHFLPTRLDKEGLRGDNRNLLQEWLDKCAIRNESCALYESPTELLAQREQVFKKERILGIPCI
ncbi:hypothetical protein Ciccas_009414 [Cichlidogyrus casuarinus]|uniref:Alkaline phosphatase n=1 Tax=Cichlidogyrus casuarinus TaxID=1844966 RepID=A0ABD2PY36_9PLAT